MIDENSFTEGERIIVARAKLRRVTAFKIKVF